MKEITRRGKYEELLDNLFIVANNYSQYTQLQKAKEEIGELRYELELTKVLCDASGKIEPPENTWSEWADVFNVGIEFAMQHDKLSEVLKWMEYKTNRQLDRIKRGE